MPKIKTRRSAAKRFKRTGGGGFKRTKAFKGHILSKKTTKRKRALRGTGMVDKTDLDRVKTLMPYK